MTAPFTRLSEQFHQLSARASRGDATPQLVLEALAHAAALSIFKGLDEVSATERKSLARKGRRTILASGPGRRRDEEAEDLAAAVALAKAGLAALDGTRGEALDGPADPLHPPDGRLAAATRGELDGFALASAALHVARCEECHRRLAVLRMAEEPAVAPLRVAAASALAMERPDDGRLLHTFGTPAAELVLFEDEGERRLAVYAEASAPVHLVSDQVETVEMLAGYWLGRVAASAERIRGTLHIGEEETAVDVGL
jgi:hypothetical protein